MAEVSNDIGIQKTYTFIHTDIRMHRYINKRTNRTQKTSCKFSNHQMVGEKSVTAG